MDFNKLMSFNKMRSRLPGGSGIDRKIAANLSRRYEKPGLQAKLSDIFSKKPVLKVVKS